MESFRRDLYNDMAEHRPILKNYRSYHPHFGFTPKIGIAFPKTGILFLLCMEVKCCVVCWTLVRTFISQEELMKRK